MADDTSVQATEDKTEEVDTSTNEEAQDTGTLEDIEVTPEDLAEDTEEQESKDETPDTEPEEPKKDSEESEEPKEDEAEEPAESEEETKEPEAEQSDEDKQKAFNKEQAERRIQEKKQRDATQREQQQDYLAQAEDDKDLALRQLQVDAYNNKVEGNSNKLTNAYEKAIKDFDILSSDDPTIKADIDAAIDAFQAQYVSVDAYGNPIDVRGDLYQHLQSKADSIAKLTGLKVTNQKTSKDKEKSKTFTPPSKAPKEPKVDADLEAFEKEAAKY